MYLPVHVHVMSCRCMSRVRASLVMLSSWLYGINNVEVRVICNGSIHSTKAPRRLGWRLGRGWRLVRRPTPKRPAGRAGLALSATCNRERRYRPADRGSRAHARRRLPMSYRGGQRHRCPTWPVPNANVTRRPAGSSPWAGRASPPWCAPACACRAPSVGRQLWGDGATGLARGYPSLKRIGARDKDHEHGKKHDLAISCTFSVDQIIVRLPPPIQGRKTPHWNKLRLSVGRASLPPRRAALETHPCRHKQPVRPSSKIKPKGRCACMLYLHVRRGVHRKFGHTYPGNIYRNRIAQFAHDFGSKFPT